MSWIDNVIKCTEESESPERYFFWSALAAISAVSRRRVYLERFFYKLYPNLYVILVGESGLRKSVPIGLAQGLVELVDCTRVFGGRYTMPAILKDLGRAYTLKSKELLTDSVGFFVNPELDDMLMSDEHAPVLLMDLYDTFTKDKWRNLTKNSGVDELKNVYLTLLGGTNEVNLLLALPKSATDGGLVARTSIILEERKKCINPLVRRPKSVPDKKELSKRLVEIANLKGVFTFDNLAGDYYERWYNTFTRLESNDKTGTVNRIGDTALKVAMCLSMAEKNDLVLTVNNIEEGIDRCLDTVVGMKKVFLEGSGEHSLAKATGLVLRTLLTKDDHKVSRKRLLQALSGVADAIDLDRIIDTLQQRGVVLLCKDGYHSELHYQMPETVAQEYRNIVKNMEKEK